MSVESGRCLLACFAEGVREVCSRGAVLGYWWQGNGVILAIGRAATALFERKKKPTPESAQLVEILDLAILPVVMAVKSHGSVW